MISFKPFTLWILFLCLLCHVHAIYRIIPYWYDVFANSILNNLDPDQVASEDASWSWSTLFMFKTIENPDSISEVISSDMSIILLNDKRNAIWYLFGKNHYLAENNIMVTVVIDFTVNSLQAGYFFIFFFCRLSVFPIFFVCKIPW